MDCKHAFGKKLNFPNLQRDSYKININKHEAFETVEKIKNIDLLSKSGSNVVASIVD